MKYFDEIEKSARERNIPVMEKEGLEFLIQTFNEHQCHRCLEIGSAIGYSAMMMVSNTPAVNTKQSSPPRAAA